MKHTPGPWNVEPLQADHGGSIAITSPRDGVLAVIQPLNSEDEPDIDDAKREPWDKPNAQLMASAPELLEMLERLKDAAELVVERWSKGDLADAVRSLETNAEFARVALKKAKARAK